VGSGGISRLYTDLRSLKTIRLWKGSQWIFATLS
jgi:hypothetical protein